jgi:hypothetical protein
MYKKRVLRGIALLTDAQLRKVDLNKLDLGNSNECVLGQIFEGDGNWFADGYDKGLSVLAPAFNPLDRNIENYSWSVRHGFTDDPHPGLSYSDREEFWKKLTKVWKFAIEVRLTHA